MTTLDVGRAGLAALEAEVERLRRRLARLEAENAELRRARRVTVELEAGRAALRASEARYRLVVESATDYAIFTTDLDRRITGWNIGAERVLGWAEVEAVGQPADVIFTPEDREAGAPEQEARGAVERGRAEDVRWHLRRDGSRLWANGVMLPLRDDAGATCGLLKILRDKTAEKRAEDELRLEREFLAALIRQAPVGISVAEAPSGRAVVLNDKARELIGHGERGEDVRRYEGYGAVHPDGRPYAVDDYPTARALKHGEEIKRKEMLYRRGGRDGAGPTRLEVSSAPVRDGDGAIVAAVTVFTDVEGQRRAEEELRRFAYVAEQSSDFVGIADPDGRVLFVNEAGRELVGLQGAAVAQARVLDFFLPEDLPFVEGVLLPAMWREGRWLGDFRFRHFGTGAPVPVRYNQFAIKDEGGRVIGIATVSPDITERKRAEARLHESEARFRHMADSAPALIWMTDADGRLTFANRHFDHVFGRPAAEMLDQGWKSAVLPEDVEAFRATALDAFHARGPFRAELRARDKDGQVRWLRCDGVPRLDDAGAFLGYTGCAVDITEAWLAADELEARVAERTAELSQALGQLHNEVLEREHAEATLRQAQKMEAVGQLTGGIAHDFNNMLQGINGALELARRRVDQGQAPAALPLMDAAQQGVTRAAALTHRLLAFARRQTLDAKPVVLDGLVLGVVELIGRTVGPSIEVRTRMGDGGWPVLCDANQLENVLLNLAINARDAMPDGGTLTLATAEVCLSAADVAGQDGAKPGDHVEIVVSDTGTGMTPAVMARVFEPFFTTKPIGQGTGLGLSQVYGFVRQSGGAMRLDSAPGHGTTVRVFLPRHQGDVAASPVQEPDQEGQGGGTGRVVLLVEDDAAVRMSAAEALRDQGYTVLEAEDGPAGLRLLADRAPADRASIDALVTDVGLPGMNGRQLAEAAREHQPGLPVLFITGYAGGALERQLAPGMEVIGKPFTLAALAAKVRRMVETGTAPPLR